MSIIKFYLALCALFCIGTASAVSLSTGKMGQVLIFPYYGVHSGNQTLIQIDSFLIASAVKVHIRGTSGEIALTFNLYMGEESWAAAIHQVNGQTYLLSNDKSCTSPRINQATLGIPLPANSGYIEVIEMGIITNSEIQDAIIDFDCDVIENLWQPEGQWTNDPSFGLVEPGGRLRGTGSLINVGEGTLYSFVATALADFSDIPQHTVAGNETPNLITPHGERTAEGFTQTRICTDNHCFEDDWESPFKALTAVLSVRYSLGEFTINTDIGAKTEVILNYPLLAYLEQQNFSVAVENKIVLYVGGLAPFEIPLPCIFPIISPACTPNFERTINSSVFTMSFNEDFEDLGTEVVSDILGETHTVFFPRDSYRTLPDQSVFRVEHRSWLTRNSISNRDYRGSAVIGVVLQKYTNGQLLNGQGDIILANYGNAFELSRELSVIE